MAAATVLAVGGTLAYKYAPAQLATMTGQTPALMSPATTEADVDRHTEVFDEAARELVSA